MGTKDKIIFSAIEIISKKGYSNSTTKEIADNAGYSEGMIFKHFKTKKDLLNEIIAIFLKNITENLKIDNMRNIIRENYDSDFEKIIDMIAEDRLFLMEENYHMIKILFTELQYHDEIKKSFINKIIKPLSKDIDELIKNQIKIGHIIEINSQTFLRILYSGLFFSVFERILLNKEFDRAEIKKEIEETKKTILYGVIKERQKKQ